MNEKIRKILTYIAFPLIFAAGMLVGRRRPERGDHRAAADEIKDKLSEGAAAAQDAGETAAKLSDTVGESSDAVRAGKESVEGAVSSAAELGNLIAEDEAIISELLSRNRKHAEQAGKDYNNPESGNSQSVCSECGGNVPSGICALGADHAGD